jgi:hypothetical protein
MDQVLEARSVLLDGMLLGDSIVFELGRCRDVNQWLWMLLLVVVER